MCKLFAFAALLVAVAAAAQATTPIVLPATPRGNASAIGCDFCKLGFWALEEFVSANKTEADIEWLLSQLCNLMPEPEKTACHNVVNAGVKEIIDLVTKFESPDEICHQLSACDGPAPVDNVPCAMCEFVMTDIERWVKEGKTEEEIESLVDSICLLLPKNSSARQVCKKVTDEGMHTIIELVLKFENPTVVCEQITLCPGSYESSMVEFGCEACDLLFTTLENWVEANKTTKEIELLLTAVCQLLPESGKRVCDKIFDAGVEEALKLLKLVESPHEICRQMGACRGPAPETPANCLVCEILMTDIENWVADGKTEKEIDHLLNALCELLGEGYKEVCDVVEDVTVAELIHMLQKYEGPEIVCQQVHLCNATSSSGF